MAQLVFDREISGADDEQTFLNFQCYPDKATLDFIVIVVKHLGTYVAQRNNNTNSRLSQNQ